MGVVEADLAAGERGTAEGDGGAGELGAAEGELAAGEPGDVESDVAADELGEVEADRAADEPGADEDDRAPGGLEVGGDAPDDGVPDCAEGLERLPGSGGRVAAGVGLIGHAQVGTQHVDA